MTMEFLGFMFASSRDAVAKACGRSAAGPRVFVASSVFPLRPLRFKDALLSTKQFQRQHEADNNCETPSRSKRERLLASSSVKEPDESVGRRRFRPAEYTLALGVPE